MKNLIIPIDHLVMLAELDDKDAGLMAKAIAQYANKGIAPSFSNSALKAIFTLFRSNIEGNANLLQNAAKSIRLMPWARSRLQKKGCQESDIN